MADDRAGFPHGLGVLVVGEIEAAAGEEPVAATTRELVCELEVAAIRRLAVELDECDLDLRVAVRPGIRVGAEDVDEQIRKAARDLEEARRAGPCRGDSGLDQVASGVELVSHLEIAPALAAVELPVAVQVAVRLLGGRDELRRLARKPLELRVRLALGLPGERLEPLVDVRVAEDHAPALARHSSRRDPQIVECPGALELLGTVEKRDLPVHPLAVCEQPVPDDDAAAVDRPEPHAGRSCWRDARADHLNGRHAAVRDLSVAGKRYYLAKRFAKRFAR